MVGTHEAVDPMTDTPLESPSEAVEAVIPKATELWWHIRADNSLHRDIPEIATELEQHLEGQTRFESEWSAAKRREGLVYEGNRYFKDITDRLLFATVEGEIQPVSTDREVVSSLAAQERIIGGLALMLAANHLHEVRLPQLFDAELLGRLDQQHREAVLEVLAKTPQQVIVTTVEAAIHDLDNVEDLTTSVNLLTREDDSISVERVSDLSGF